jgi:hypothetical protein
MKLVQFSVPSVRPRSLGVTIGKWMLVAVVLMVALPYAWGPIYHFPAPSTFTGAKFFNPYAELRGTWQRANLHAHGRAWSGITNGQQPDEEVVAKYHSLGYTVAGVSDYERIAALHGVPTMPIYEHGYNIGKRHQLAIGARDVEWFDFLLWQSASDKQYILDRVGASTDLVAINHPSLRDAYSKDDLRKLTGYQLMEVVNGPDRQDNMWDAALSSGHVVWALANDDAHDVNDPRRIGLAWNMIDAPTPSNNDVIEALRAGRTYAVARKKAGLQARETTVRAVHMNDEQLVVTCSGEPATFEFIGQDGSLRGTVKNTLSADYTFSPDDTYIRTVISAPRATMYLNPVLRYDGAHIPAPASTVEAGTTWLMRGTCFFAGVAAILALRRRKPASLPLPEASPIVIDRRKSA